MTDAWPVARAWILSAEGGYVNDSRDPGGETKFGISKRAYPMLNIAALTEDEAAKIYQRDYWTAAGCSLLPPALALAVFDAAVNQGVATAVRLLQMELRVHVDGTTGFATAAAARAVDLAPLIVRYLERRWDRYHDTNGAGTYLRGWTHRLFQLLPECLALVEAA